MAYRWRIGANHGGGYGQVADADGDQLVVVGDMWGIYRSADAGRTWRPSYNGAPGIPSGRAVAFSHRSMGWAYVGVGVSHGSTPGSGYFGVVSPEGKVRIVDRAPHGFGLNIPDANAQQPRPAGRIIVVVYDRVKDIEYAYACAPTGITRYTNDAMHTLFSNSTLAPMRTAVTSQCWKAAIAWDADNLLLATFGKTANGSSQVPRVYRVSGIRGDAIALTVVKQNVEVNAFRFVAGELYAACRDGLYKITSPTSWTKIATFDRLATDVAGDSSVLFVSQARFDPSKPSMPIGHAVARSTDEGKTWTWSAGNASRLTYGTSDVWWLSATYPSGAISGTRMDVQELAYSNGILYAFGRKTCWASPDKGLTWYPASKGIGATAEVNISLGSKVNVKDQDWGAAVSSDRFQSAQQGSAYQTYPTPQLQRTVGGHTYRFVSGVPCDVQRDGTSIGDDLFRSWAVEGNVEDLQVAVDGTVYLCSSGGALLVGDPV